MRAVCFALALCALPSAGALAQGMYGSPEDGFYLELAAGYAQFTDNDRDIGGGIEAGVEYGPGFEVRGQAGYKFSYFRAGVELQYAQTNFDALSVAGMGIDADGSPSVWRTTVNGYFDLDNQSRFTPYAGGGLGLAFVSGDEISAGGGHLRSRGRDGLHLQCRRGGRDRFERDHRAGACVPLRLAGYRFVGMV